MNINPHDLGWGTGQKHKPLKKLINWNSSKLNFGELKYTTKEVKITTYGMGENIANHVIWQGYSIQNK